MISIIKNKKSVGIDIADQTIEIAELERIDNEIRVNNLSQLKIKPGVVERGRIKDETELGQLLEVALFQGKPEAISDSEVVFAIPENQIYTHVFKISDKENFDLPAEVEKELAKCLPIAKEDIVYTYKALNTASESGAVYVL